VPGVVDRDALVGELLPDIETQMSSHSCERSDELKPAQGAAAEIRTYVPPCSIDEEKALAAS